MILSPNLSSESIITKIKESFESGNYNECLEQISTFEQEFIENLEYHLELQIYKARCFLRKGELDQASELASKCFQESNKISPILQIQSGVVWSEALRRKGQIDHALSILESTENLFTELTGEELSKIQEEESNIFHLKGNIYNSQGDLDTALNYYLQSLELQKEIGNQQHIASTLNNIGVIHYNKGDLNAALDYYHRGLKIGKEIGFKQGIASSFNNIGVIYRHKGELNKALKYLQQGLELTKEIGNQQDIADYLNNIGNVYRDIGDPDDALDYYQQSLVIKKEMGNQQRIATTLNNIGTIYRLKGDLDAALNYYQQSLEIRKEIGNQQVISMSLVELISICLEGSVQVDYKPYIDQLEAIASSSHHQDNKNIQLRFRLAKALIFKSSDRMKVKNKSTEILETIVYEKVIDHQLTIVALKHYCEMLFYELQSLGGKEAFDETKTIVNRLYDIAQHQNSFSTLIESLILKAKLSQIEGKIEKVPLLLEKALIIAEEKGLIKLRDVVRHEQQQSEADISKWQELLARSASMSERIEQANIISYINEVQKQLSFYSTENNN